MNDDHARGRTWNLLITPQIWELIVVKRLAIGPRGLGINQSIFIARSREISVRMQDQILEICNQVLLCPTHLRDLEPRTDTDHIP
jgi:hypothetical protein